MTKHNFLLRIAYFNKLFQAIYLRVIYFLLILLFQFEYLVAQQVVSFGDADRNGSIDSSDVTNILLNDLNIPILSKEFLSCGDVNRDGEINSTDALIISSFIENISSPLNIVGQPCTGPPLITSCVAEPEEGRVPLEIAFKLEVNDPDGGVLSYFWDFGDGYTDSTEDPIHIYELEGDYLVFVIVFDDQGFTDTCEKMIMVRRRLADPEITQCEVDSSRGNVPLIVSFQAEAFDPDGGEIDYTWEFGDGNSSIEKDPTHRYSVAGSYVAQLTVTDDEGNQKSCEVPIEVIRPLTVLGVFPSLNGVGRQILICSSVPLGPKDNIIVSFDEIIIEVDSLVPTGDSLVITVPPLEAGFINVNVESNFALGEFEYEIVSEAYLSTLPVGPTNYIFPSSANVTPGVITINDFGYIDATNIYDLSHKIRIPARNYVPQPDSVCEDKLNSIEIYRCQCPMGSGGPPGVEAFNNDSTCVEVEWESSFGACDIPKKGIKRLFIKRNAPDGEDTYRGNFLSLSESNVKLPTYLLDSLKDNIFLNEGESDTTLLLLTSLTEGFQSIFIITGGAPYSEDRPNIICGAEIFINESDVRPLKGKAPLTITVNGNAFDKEARPLDYLWTFGDGTFSTEKRTTHTYTESGIYPVRLEVSINEEINEFSMVQIVEVE